MPAKPKLPAIQDVTTLPSHRFFTLRGRPRVTCNHTEAGHRIRLQVAAVVHAAVTAEARVNPWLVRRSVIG
jgi:hypothetical protein